MSERPDAWAERRRAWRVEPLAPSLDPLPGRRDGFAPLRALPTAGLDGPWAWGREGHAARDGTGPGGPPAVDHTGEPLRAGTGRYADFDPVRDIGLPGEPPFTRGVHPTGYRSRPWTMRMFAGF